MAPAWETNTPRKRGQTRFRVLGKKPTGLRVYDSETFSRKIRRSLRDHFAHFLSFFAFVMHSLHDLTFIGQALWQRATQTKTPQLT
jgi:hypothetical protein